MVEQKKTEIRYLNAPSIDTKKKKYCRFKKSGIKYIDSGTNPPEVSFLTQLVDDLCLGYKLPGAGGGGYLYMIAKDPDAALRIRKTLTAESPNPNSRFVEMSLSESGTTVSRS